MKRYTETLRAVAPALARHRYGYEMLRTLAEHERDAAAEFDSAEAIYYVASTCHSGQACPLYAALCASLFAPGAGWRRPERGSTAATIAADLLRTLKPWLRP